MSCRFCNNKGMHEILDLGHQPPSNSFLTKEQLREPEVHYPLKLFVCDKCWLVQIPETKKAQEIFTEDYAYYSSESPANVSHAKDYCEMMLKRFPKITTVMEIGSNDGYMLQWFKKAGCEVFGIDPAEGPAEIAHSKGIDVECSFFTERLASFFDERFDLICGINVLNHQPDINDFVSGLNIALAPGGYITFEFPHLMHMVEKRQFDTIYHEHLNYYSLYTLDSIFIRHGLYIFDVDELPKHGGSLRIYATKEKRAPSNKAKEIIGWEIDYGIATLDYYKSFGRDVAITKNNIQRSIYSICGAGKSVIAYGAAAKCSVLMNCCGFDKQNISYVADKSPHKIGKYLPGSHIPVKDPETIRITKPDYVLITAWNLQEEIMEQLAYIKSWGGKFIIPLPDFKII
ncbi:MAG TPA: class I SAM-dependent methyltransferase [Smithellaceae bacterium]|nr:class I SAM-dependent methyltransferase [Smithellaceae bacterium]